MTPIERACERVMHRMNESINRSAGQHMRAIRKAHAQPVIESAEPEPVQADAFVSRIADQQESDDAMGAMRMLAYALVSLALVGAAVTVAIAITLFNQP
jgi:hypothetical protein